MKKRWLGIRIVRVAAALCAALGWWGFLYPELALTPDTVVLRMSDDGGIMREQAYDWEFDSALYRDLLDAGPERIMFRSRLVTDFGLLLEALEHGDR